MKPLALLPVFFTALSVAMPGAKAGDIPSILQAAHELPPPVWKRLIEVRSIDGKTLRHYLIFKLHGTFFCYRLAEGSRRIWPVGESATAFARAAMPGYVEGIFLSPESL
jgi:hypothetical protein